MNGAENEGVRTLLEEIRRTISDNRLFLKKLKSDDAGLGAEETDEAPGGDEDAFEEL